MTVATLALASLFPLLPLENRELAKSAAATAAMISNYFFSASADYFAPQAEINPLLHTWSLGVEEQYYLLTPVAMSAVVALAVRRNWNATHALLAGALIAFAISYIAMEIVNIHDRRVAFFSIMTRSWQFAAGGVLALAVLRGSPVPPRLRSPIGVIGLMAIAAAVVLYNEHLRYPGGATGLLPTCGAVLLLASGLGNDRAPLTRILASRPAVAIGVLSYSWYLWHWPLTELARTLPIGQDSIWKDVASDGVALAAFGADLSADRTSDEIAAAAGVHARFGGAYRRAGCRRLGTGRGAGAAAGAKPIHRAEPGRHFRPRRRIKASSIAGPDRDCRNSAT